ncbi:MAG: hypothetical protein ACM31O_21110 [Bacteroidota bacterium]
MMALTMIFLSLLMPRPDRASRSINARNAETMAMLAARGQRFKRSFLLGASTDVDSWRLP